MLAPVVAALFAITPPPPCAAPSPTPAVRQADSTLVALFDGGQPYDVFLAETKARRELWTKLSRDDAVPADVLATVANVRGPLRVLVVAIDSCSDSANTIPFVARLVARMPDVQLRVVKPDAGQAVMEAHRTPDGRAATPTVVVLDAAGREVGCWVERPSVLQQMAVDARAAGTLDQYAANKQSWYDADHGLSTLRELATVLAAAHTDHPLCSSATAR